MNPVNQNGGDLVDQNHALDRYFEALLWEQLPQDHDGPPSDAPQRVPQSDVFSASPQETTVDGIPLLGEQFLDAIIFTVDGLHLALPAVKLARIVDFPSEIQSTEGSPPWHMGCCKLEGQSIDIIDPAEVVIPPSHRVRSSDARRHDMHHLLLIDGVPWGLACQAVETVTLDIGQIHWRTTHSLRQWLAGTAMSYECGLLDVDGLLSQLTAL